MGNPTEKQLIGKLGEDIAERFLVKHGHVIIERNFSVKGGEIDIISRKKGILYFTEVKSVSRENISRETSDDHRPEDNIHPGKLKRMNLAISLFLSFNKMEDLDWEILGVAVSIDKTTKQAKVKLLDDFAW